jgi:hypothetical protein
MTALQPDSKTTGTAAAPAPATAPVPAARTAAGIDLSSAETERVTWYSPVEDMWVASTPSDYLGMVDRNHDGFVATDGCGRDLGVHETLEEARLAVYREWANPTSTDEPFQNWAKRIATITAVMVGAPALAAALVGAALVR